MKGFNLMAGWSVVGGQVSDFNNPSRLRILIDNLRRKRHM